MISRSSAAFNPKDYWEQRLSAHPGLCGVGNTLLGDRYIQWLYRMRRSVFLRLMRSFHFDFPASDVFDIGSGTGFYLGLWQELGARSITGCDLTNTAVSRLQSDFPGSRIERLDIGDRLPAGLAGKYAMVSAFDVLFHIVDDGRYAQALQNIHSLLAPAGVFVFSDLLIQENAVKDIHMVCRLRNEILGKLKETGFEVIRRVPMFVAMEQPLDSKNRAYRFLWKLMSSVLRRSNGAGFIAGALLYPMDQLLTRICKESPTTEIVVCRKRCEGIAAT